MHQLPVFRTFYAYIYRDPPTKKQFTKLKHQIRQWRRQAFSQRCVSVEDLLKNRISTRVRFRPIPLDTRLYCNIDTAPIIVESYPRTQAASETFDTPIQNIVTDYQHFTWSEIPAEIVQKFPRTPNTPYRPGKRTCSRIRDINNHWDGSGKV